MFGNSARTMLLDEESQRLTEIGQIDRDIDNIRARIIKTQDNDLIELYEEELKNKLTRKRELGGNKFDGHLTDKEFGTATKLVLGTLRSPASMWQSPNWQDRRTIVLMYFDGKLTYEKERGFGTATLASPIKLMQDFSVRKVQHVEMGAVKPRVVRTTLKHLQA